MNNEKESQMDDLVQRIGEVFKSTQKLSQQAAQIYSAEIEDILETRSRDVRRIEWCLDYMLGFCFDEEMLVLYKKLCRYYFKIDPGATAEYVYAYRDMWDE